MGYRSTFVTDDNYMVLPDWFVDKYRELINFGERHEHPAFPLSSKWERKFYSGAEEDLFMDIARILRENDDNYPREVTVALLHEDGEIDRVVITPSSVKLERSLDGGGYNPHLGESDHHFIEGDAA